MMHKILIIDDEPLNIKLLEVYLEQEPYEVFSAPNANKALELLEAGNKIDLILLDRMMPDMDGVELVRRLKNKPNLCNIPVIMQSAAAGQEKVLEGLSSGALHYLIKPYDQDTLLKLMHEVLRDEI